MALGCIGMALAVLLVALLIPGGGPRDGWGPNDRAWFDDEFWMDVLIQGVGWLLLILSISVSAAFFYRQRQAALEDARELHRRQRRERSVEGLPRLCSDLARATANIDNALEGLDREAALAGLRQLTAGLNDVVYFGTITIGHPINQFLAHMIQVMEVYTDPLSAALRRSDHIPSSWAAVSAPYIQDVWTSYMRTIPVVEHWIETGNVDGYQPELPRLSCPAFLLEESEDSSATRTVKLS